MEVFDRSNVYSKLTKTEELDNSLLSKGYKYIDTQMLNEIILEGNRKAKRLAMKLMKRVAKNELSR